MDFEENFPRVIWRIPNFSTVTCKSSSPFHFLNSDWQWEYHTLTDDLQDTRAEKATIFLIRITAPSSSYPIKRFLSIVYTKNDEGKRSFEQVFNYDVVPLNKWVVWEVQKESVIRKGLVWNDCCTFSCSLEPIGNFEEMALLKKETQSFTFPCLESLSKDFNSLFTCDGQTDITLKCGNKKYKAHRAVLAARSKKFSYLALKDNSSTSNELVIVTDTPEVFEKLMSYIYTGSIDLSIETVEKIYRATEKYNIEPLKKRCALFIIGNLCHFEPCNILLMAKECKDDYLMYAAASYIANKEEILFSKEWKQFSYEHEMLAIDVFSIFVERTHLRS